MSTDEMRVAVAEVMGWAKLFYVEMHAEWYGTQPGFTAGDKRLPDYPTDPAAALTFCDWLAEQFWSIEATGLGTPSVQVVICKTEDSPYVEATAPTLSLAICEAGLRALGIYHD